MVLIFAIVFCVRNTYVIYQYEEILKKKKEAKNVIENVTIRNKMYWIEASYQITKNGK